MRVLVTGSTGLLGRAAAERLLAAGHEVIGLARGATGDERFAAELRADIGAPGLVARLDDVPACEAVVHCAAARGGDDQAPEITLANCLGTQQVLALARAWGTRRFVFLSGVTVIGEPRLLPVTEDHPVDPPSAYLASKLFGERLVALVSRDGIDGVSLRISAPVGPRMPAGRILPTFVRRALAGEPLEVAGRGSRRQDYVDARDVAVAVELALERSTSPLLNIAAGRSCSNLELARRCIAVLGSDAEIAHAVADPQDGLAWEVSIERAGTELGWRPRRSLEELIRELAAAQRSPAGTPAPSAGGADRSPPSSRAG